MYKSKSGTFEELKITIAPLSNFKYHWLKNTKTGAVIVVGTKALKRDFTNLNS